MPSLLRFSGDWQAAAQSTAERCADLIPSLAETLTRDLDEARQGVPGAREQVEVTTQRILGACIGFGARAVPTSQQSERIKGIQRAARYTLVQLGKAKLEELSHAQ
jgi:hypothetical protein